MPQLPAMGRGSIPRAAPPHDPPPHSCGRAGPLPRGGGGGARAQCWGRSRLGMRPRPRPLSPGWEGERGWPGVSAGDSRGPGCRGGHHPPPTAARGRRGQSPALTHPRAESGQGTDSGGAHARRRGASAKCRGEWREVPTRRGQAGRQRLPVSLGAVGGAGTLALPGLRGVALLREPLAPGEACRLRQRRGLHLRDGPLPHDPALREARPGCVEKFPIPGEQRLRDPRGGWRRTGKVKTRHLENCLTDPRNPPLHLPQMAPRTGEGAE